MIRQGSNPKKKENIGEEELRDKILKVSVNLSEIKEIQRRAEKIGFSRSRYMREVSLGHKPKTRDTTIAPELIKLNAHLGKIGSNINQIARAMNKAGVSEVLLAEAKNRLEEIGEIVKNVNKLILGK